jgi:hypothetical protein
MEQTYRDPSGFSLKYPEGWKAFRHQSGAAMVTNLHDLAFVLIQELSMPLPGGERYILAQLQFPGAVLLAQPKVGPVENPAPGLVSCYVNFKFPNDARGQALVTCEKLPNCAIVTVCAARDLDRMGPVLWQIRRSYTGDRIRTPMHPAPNPAPVAPPPRPPQPPPPLPPQALIYTRYTDPQAGTFTIEVPQG